MVKIPKIFWYIFAMPLFLHSLLNDVALTKAFFNCQSFSESDLKETGLSYGVTVALQILVLSVKVRILVAQQSPSALRGDFFWVNEKANSFVFLDFQFTQGV